ncbi:putative reverse transcriptase domain-containing protein [Tanacetum coccineum]
MWEFTHVRGSCQKSTSGELDLIFHRAVAYAKYSPSILSTILGSRPLLIPGRVLVTPGSVITTGSILVTPGSVITTGSILVTPGSVITTGSILVTPGSVITTGSILVTPGMPKRNFQVDIEIVCKAIVIPSRVLVPPGSVVVPTGSVVVPTGSVVVPPGSVVVPTSPPVRRALSSRLRLQHLKKVRVQRKDSNISFGIGLDEEV